MALLLDRWIWMEYKPYYEKMPNHEDQVIGISYIW